MNLIFCPNDPQRKEEEEEEGGEEEEEGSKCKGGCRGVRENEGREREEEKSEISLHDHP